MIKKACEFKYNVGDDVMVSNPMNDFGIKSTVVQQIKPMAYPEGNLHLKSLILLPRTRKEYRTTRQISYLLRTEDKPEDLYFWATEMCLKK